MRLSLVKSFRSASTLRAAVLAAACFLIHVPSSFAQMLPSEMDGNPNEVLVFEQMRVPRWLAETVVRAAQVTGVDPAYLMALADKESSLLPDSKARTSSAQGLFQFIESTWLEVLRRYGPKHGYVAEAEAIQIVAGRPVVSDDKDRERILNLRSIPYLSALMAGEMINTHREILAGKVARDPSFAELYMAHFLGVNGASRFVALLSDQPGKSAPEAFPSAAKANRTLFYAKADKAEAAAKANAKPKALSVPTAPLVIGFPVKTWISVRKSWSMRLWKRPSRPAIQSRPSGSQSSCCRRAASRGVAHDLGRSLTLVRP